MINTTVGSKYYKYLEDGSLQLLRLERIKNQDSYVMRKEDGSKINLNRDEFMSHIKLNSDGYITFAIVGLSHGMQDVIVSLHRKKDIDNCDTIPYCVCRQSIFDLFTNQLERNDKITHIGVSVTKDTCPLDINYEMALSCNGIGKMTIVNIYLDDTLNDILSYIHMASYDEVLKHLHDNTNHEITVGSCGSLRHLLDDNNFMEDFHRAFNIIYVPYTVSVEGLTPVQYVYLEGVIKHEIIGSLVIKYDKDIDLAKIESKYLLVSDDTETLYIVAYREGAPINREYEQLTDKRDREVLLQSINSK